MMMKKLITTLGFILAVTWTSCVMAAAIPDTPPEINVAHPANIIKNEVCIESDRIQWEHCAHVNITVTDDQYACLSIASSWSVVELNSHGNWSMKFTCRAVDTSTSHNYKIDCGNGQSWTKVNWSSSWSYTCNYWTGDFWKSYDVTCYVDGAVQNNLACIKGITVGYGIFWECWDWVIDPGEDCDFTNIQFWVNHSIGNWLNDGDPKRASDGYNTANWYYCYNCMLVYSGGGFVYEPAECFSTDKPISVMNNEMIPFWWKLNVGMTNNNITVTDDKSECTGWSADRGTLIYPTDCHFAIYNWTHKQGDADVTKFNIRCYNDNFAGKIYRYFGEVHNTPQDGAALYTVNAYTDWNANWNNAELWEYKIVLERVDYDVCNPVTKQRTWWKRSGPVCEVNAAITRPYAMQISTFGAKPIGVLGGNKFLYNFYDMQWKDLLDKTDLGQIMNIEDAQYSNEANVQDEINKFRNKYEKLAIKVNLTSTVFKTTRAIDLFGSNAKTVKKVPNQHIYFVEWNGGTITIDQTQFSTNSIPAYTIFVYWSDVEIKWDVLQYAMIITTEQMSFKDGNPGPKMSCADWWQVVQWLYVAWGWFKQADENLRNDDESWMTFWCPWWWLHVKWALIWDWITNIMKWKRSQLNSWFNIYTNNPERERREKIIWWAAVLIEYSPSLWKTLPPGAEVFTESLEVYRK